MLSQWFVNGWFPIFPWLAVALLGAGGGSFRWREIPSPRFARHDLAQLAEVSAVLGAPLLMRYAGGPPQSVRIALNCFTRRQQVLFLIAGIIFSLFVIADILPIYSRAVR